MEERAMRLGASACLRKAFKNLHQKKRRGNGIDRTGTSPRIQPGTSQVECRDDTRYAPGDEITNDARNYSVKGWTK
jgi:hypothetical protein